MRSFFDSIFLFCLLIYSTILVDNASNYISLETVNHPLIRFSILLLIFYYIYTEEFVALVILFAYILTIYSFLTPNKINYDKPLTFEKKPVIIKKRKENKKRDKKMNTTEFIVHNKDSDNFTTEIQFKDVQSNIFNDEAMNTEICIWKKGYSTQGIKKMI